MECLARHSYFLCAHVLPVVFFASRIFCARMFCFLCAHTCAHVDGLLYYSVVCQSVRVRLSASPSLTALA